MSAPTVLIRLPRSYLFVPGDRPERYAKARAAGADAVIVDLEDAVAPEAKPRAREALAAALDEAAPIIVRVNAAGTPWFADDLELCRHPGVAAIMLPKAEGIDAACAVVEVNYKDVAIIERRAASRHARRACPASCAWCSAAPIWRWIWASTVRLMVRRQSSWLFVPTVLARGWPGWLRRSTRQHRDRRPATLARTPSARRLGFGAVVHPPEAAAIVQAVFTPTPERLDWRAASARHCIGRCRRAVDARW